jgi:cytosine/adenosine deaminase-related metal-dependent hydrolase
MGQWLKRVHVNDGLNSIYLDEGFIRRIVPEEQSHLTYEREWDAQGFLMLPTFKDYHVHLDKSFPSNRWISRKPVSSLFEQFQLEKDLMAPLKRNQLDRARQTLQQLLDYGTTEMRVHVDIDPDIGLSHLETILTLKEEFISKLKLEIVAFPQQGLIRSSSQNLIKQALQQGASIVGAVDPAGVDQDIEASLSAIFRLSVECDAEIDIHLHDPGHLGLFTLERIVDYTLRYGKQGKVAVSHAYCLGEVEEAATHAIVGKIAEADITIISSVPIDSAMPRVSHLVSQGVNVRVGTDHTGLDAWTPFGDGDLLSRGRRMAEKYMWNDDDRLCSVFPYIAASPIRFREGDKANFILLDALNPQHAIATAPTREIVCVNGTAVAGRKLQTAWAANSNLKTEGCL